jgi:hypothetical protein
MRLLNYLLFSVCLSGLTFSTLGETLTATPTTSKNLKLYLEPNEQSQVLKELQPNTRLISVYQKNDWLKVGNTENGEIGWINLKQYQELLKSIQKEEAIVKSVVITVTDKLAEKGKTEIIAYQNGKKLAEKEAKVLWQQISEQEMHIEKHFMNMQHEMNELFQRSMHWFNQMFGGTSDIHMPMMLHRPPHAMVPQILVVDGK